MADTSERIEQLERSVRRMRRGMMALVAALGCVAMLGAIQSKELDLTKLQILDGEGKRRFLLGISPGGAAVFGAMDQGEKTRFAMMTDSDGSASFSAYDQNDKVRFSFGTLPVRAYLTDCPLSAVPKSPLVLPIPPDS